MKILHTDRRELHLFAVLQKETAEHAPAGEKTVGASLLSVKNHDNARGVWLGHVRFGLANYRALFALYGNYGTLEINVLFIKVNIY